MLVLLNLYKATSVLDSKWYQLWNKTKETQKT